MQRFSLTVPRNIESPESIFPSVLRIRSQILVFRGYELRRRAEVSNSRPSEVTLKTEGWNFGKNPFSQPIETKPMRPRAERTEIQRPILRIAENFMKSAANPIQLLMLSMKLLTRWNLGFRSGSNSVAFGHVSASFSFFFPRRWCSRHPAAKSDAAIAPIKPSGVCRLSRRWQTERRVRNPAGGCARTSAC